MPVLYTIGFQGKALSEFISLLRRSGVDAVIDVRLRNTSQLAGYTKRDDLRFLLQEGFGIAYEHRPELAPTPEIFDAYRREKDWPAYEAQYGPLLVDQQAETIAHQIFARYQAPCLLCSEPTADQCHRRLIAEYWTNHIQDLVVLHL